MHKKIASQISEDYVFDLVDIFQELVTDQLESKIVLQDIVERHVDVSKYDTTKLTKDISEFETMDILEELIEEFEHKFMTRIAERIKERVLEVDIDDYLE